MRHLLRTRRAVAVAAAVACAALVVNGPETVGVFSFSWSANGTGRRRSSPFDERRRASFVAEQRTTSRVTATTTSVRRDMVSAPDATDDATETRSDDDASRSEGRPAAEQQRRRPREPRAPRKKNPTEYERWLEETYDWMRLRAEEDGTSELPEEIWENARDLVRGWTHVYPSHTTQPSAPLRWECARRAEWIVRRFRERRGDRDLPDAWTYATAIDAWGMCAHERDGLVPARNAHDLLRVLLEDERIAKAEMRNNPFATVFLAYVANTNMDGLEGAANVLRELQDRFDARKDECSLGDDEDDDDDDFDPSCVRRLAKPTMPMYNKFLTMAAKLSLPSKTDTPNARRARELALEALDGMERQYLVSGNEAARPSSYSYTSVMSLFSTKLRAKDAEKVLRRFERMVARERRNDPEGHLRGDNDPLRPPDVVCYNSVINCWARSRSPDAGARARVVLDGMAPDLPNRRSFNAVVLAYAKSGHPVLAERALDEMTERGVRPDVRTYTTVMNAWGRSDRPERAERAVGLLRRLQEAYETSSVDESLRPNTIAYTAALDALAFSREPTNRADVAIGLLEEMERDARDNPDVAPDVRCYNSVLNALSRSVDETPDAGRRAEDILARINARDDDSTGAALRPDAFSHNSVLLTLVRERAPESSARARDLLLRMEDDPDRPNPSVDTYSMVMNSLVSNAHRDGPDAAEDVAALLDRLVAANDPKRRPDRPCYRAVLQAWSRSVDPEKGRRAREVLERAREARGVRPNTSCHAVVLNACAHTRFRGDPDDDALREVVFDVAKRTFRELRDEETLHLDESAYAVFLRCCKVLLPPDNDESDDDDAAPRRRILLALLKQAAADGLVSLRFVKECMEEKVFRRLLHGYLRDEDDDDRGRRRAPDATTLWKRLPEEWKRSLEDKRSNGGRGATTRPATSDAATESET